MIFHVEHISTKLKQMKYMCVDSLISLVTEIFEKLVIKLFFFYIISHFFSGCFLIFFFLLVFNNLIMMCLGFFFHVFFVLRFIGLESVGL